jgi:hypothetical protein
MVVIDLKKVFDFFSNQLCTNNGRNIIYSWDNDRTFNDILKESFLKYETFLKDISHAKRIKMRNFVTTIDMLDTNPEFATETKDDIYYH